MPLFTDDNFSEPFKINQDALNRFLSFCKRRKIPKKGIVFREGEPADSMLYVISGSLTAIVEDEEGNELILSYLNSGEFLGEIGLFYHVRKRSAMVRARSECELAEISYEKLQELFKKELREEQAQIMTAVGVQLSDRLLKCSRRISLLTSVDVAGRIARALLDMCHEPEAMSHPEGTQIHISRQEIARIVGCTRETVGRVLKQMQDDGMVDVKGMDIVVYHSR